MSDQNSPITQAPGDPALIDPTTGAPQVSQHHPQSGVGAAGQPGASVSQAAAGQPVRKLSTFLKVSIILLAGLTIASISLLFIGDFEGKFERVFSTFVLFAVFVLFTALDTRREQKSEWYAPVALIANSYILALLLIVIWMTRFSYFGLVFEIFWKSLFVIVVTRLVILCCQWLLRTGTNLPEAVTRFAFVTSVLAVLSGILFTAPVGVEAFDLYIPDLYWRIATALLILTALSLSITLLLQWFYGADRRESVRAARAAQHLRSQQQAQAQQQAQQQALAMQHLGQNDAAQGQFAMQQPVQAPGSQAAQPLLPWPTFADGSPLPAGPDGQPDFAAVQR